MLDQPKEFNEFLFEKSLIFKVELQEFASKQIELVFNVIDIYDDYIIIAKFKQLESGIPNSEVEIASFSFDLCVLLSFMVLSLTLIISLLL